MAPAIPLLAHRDPDQVVAWRGASPVTLARFLGDVAQIAERLPGDGYVMNLCSDRYRFAVALAAALCRGRPSLLPHTTAPEVLRRIARDYPAVVLVDPGAPIDPVPMGVVVDAGGQSARTEVPALDPAQLAVVAFTSGSTAQPLPQLKTWGSLARGAEEEVHGLELAALRSATLVGTVPPQHMYGLESTVVLALRCGFALHSARPLYPADVRDALAQAPEPRVLVTTPVHLRALLTEDIELPALHLVVCATAPLPPALAARAEAKYGAPLREIYGFTEAGMVATRRTAQESAWRTLPGITVHVAGGVACFQGGHVEREIPAADILDVIDSSTFALQGRRGDLMNVAGKRTSLAYLNHELSCVEGVQDGVFFMPEESDAAVTRPMAFVVAPGLSRDQLLAALRSRIDPAFLPRPLHFVQALPRNATGKLPRDALATLAARLATEPAKSSVPLLSADHPVARGHFPGNPIVPGAVILDEVLRAAETSLDLPPCAWEIRAAKFLSPARPGEELCISLVQRAAGELKFECSVGERTVASGTLRPLPDPDAPPA